MQALGLASVRYFSQLLPLPLEWLHADDSETRLLAAQVCFPCKLLSKHAFGLGPISL